MLVLMLCHKMIVDKHMLGNFICYDFARAVIIYQMVTEVPAQKLP